MFSEDKVTEIFCLADEFCKFFDAQQEKSMLKAPVDGKRHRRKPNRMSDAEIIVILINFHSGGFRCFKHYYLHYICKHCKHLESLFVDGIQLFTKVKNNMKNSLMSIADKICLKKRALMTGNFLCSKIISNSR